MEHIRSQDAPKLKNALSAAVPSKNQKARESAAQPQRLQTTDKTVGNNVEQREEMCLFLRSLGNPGLPGPRRAWACSHLQALLTVGESSSQGSAREEWGLPVSDHTGETGEARGTSVSINVLRNFVTSQLQQTLKHMSPRNFFLPLYFSPMYIFKTMESICV